MEKEYDVIIIGGGPNGLTAGTYLSKAGLKVIVLERRTESGGGLHTEESTLPLFRHNTHALYMMMTDYAPAYKDFDLENSYNIKHAYPPLQFAMPFKDGRCLCLYTDVEKTCESIARFSQKDADTYRETSKKFDEYVEAFLAPATYAQVLPVLDSAVKMQQDPIGKEIYELSEKTPKEIVFDLYENDHVRALMLYAACYWGLDYNQNGVGYLVPLYLDRATNYKICIGGSHMLSQAIHQAMLHNGGQSRTSKRITRIIVEDNKAVGVELKDGTVIKATKAVLSTIDTHQTFLDLIGEDKLQDEFAQSIKAWKWEWESHLTLHLAMDSNPSFAVAENNNELNESLIYLIGLESTDDVIGHFETIRRGELPDNGGFSVTFPSMHDPSQAPEGRCTAYITKLVPYALNDGGAERWYNFKFKEAQAQLIIDKIEEYAPGFKEKVLWQYITTPIDIGNKLEDMVNGSIKQGDYHPLQMGYNRPNMECSTHRSPIKGLYMGGACTYPGGCVLLGSGYLAADAIVEDLGIEKWWTEPDHVKAAREKGLL